MCLSIVFVVLALTGCGGDSDEPLTPVGGPCTYREWPGEAVITQAAAADPEALNCDNQPVSVLFDFTPDAPSTPADYLFPSVEDQGRALTLGEGLNPPRAWVEREGLAPGSSHAAVRMEITSGTCTPVLFRVSGADTTGWEDLCW